MVSSCLGSIVEFYDSLLYASASALVGTVYFSTLSSSRARWPPSAPSRPLLSAGCAVALPESAHRHLADMLNARTGG
jgi:hypothetical protein